MPDDRITKSGYDLTIKAFVPADPRRPTELVDVINKVNEVAKLMGEKLGVAVEVSHVFRARKTVADAPASGTEEAAAS